jgi:proteasome lid subunit RPN8/RPN11
VEIPIQSPRDDRDTGVDMRAFITSVTTGDIAVNLGIALKQEESSEGSSVGYVKAIPATSPDLAGLAAIVVQSAEVHLEFERDLATRLAGRQTADARRAVLVGAGAIGSHVADDLAREGRFEWTVIDDDQVLPHNLARHTAVSAQVTKPKAEIVAAHLNSILSGAPIAVPINVNLFGTASTEEAVRRALDNAEIIIDTSASVVAARALSDGPFGGRRISVFFNPTGEAAVLLAEPHDRSATLRDLEAQYYGLLLRTPRLANHLGKLAQTVAYTGACRALTNQIPASRATILSGLAANGIASIVDRDDGTVRVWSLSASGEVTVDEPELEPVIHYRAKGWTVAIDVGVIRRIYAMRQAKLPCETGGILFGLVDIIAKQIHLVEATPAPLNSIEEPGQFVRGMEGVDETMEDVQRRTAGQIRYVGEWHSHPPRYSARPSDVDGVQLDWLAALMGMDSMPALMVIAADTQLAVIFASERAECADLSAHRG